jgi:starch synthase
MDLPEFGKAPLVKEIWLVARELGGWAEAGGVKDVVRDQALAFASIGWTTHVVIPFYGYLRTHVEAVGTLAWRGTSHHPSRPAPVEAWVVDEASFTVHFLRSPGFDDKNSLYTYTAEDEARDPAHVRGQGFCDGFQMNLEFQWSVASYWKAAELRPSVVLGHDGHVGYLPAVAKAHPGFEGWFDRTTFGVLIHNAGSGYRQEMPATADHEALIGLPGDEAGLSVLERQFEPLLGAARHSRLATVSANYANELKTGRNDHWSGPFGRWLRTTKTPLEGITNGLSTDDKDPRDPDAAGIPAGFDPLKGDWDGKNLCRRALREKLLLRPQAVYGRLVRWDGPLYVMQGRLTAQKGVDALYDLTARALREKPRASFLIMAQGEKRYEERMIQLARKTLQTGSFAFVNKFEESLSRLVFAAGDFFLMPSEYEPCGLTDLKAQLMGNLPIVHRVGGLVKVRDGKTGFSYDKHLEGGFWGAFVRTLRLWEDDPEAIAVMRRQAFLSVLEDFQWTRILEEHYVPWLTDPAPFPILTAIPPT